MSVPRVSAVVLATPRRSIDPSIQRELTGRATTVLDPGDPPSHWRGYRSAWLAASEPDADWAMVIEDDAELCPGFATAAIRALEQAPTDAVHFYPVRKACRTAYDNGRSWAYPPDWLNSQAIALRTPLARALVPWCEATEQAAMSAYCTNYGDCRLKAYLRAVRVRMAFTVPGLVQHARVPSLLGNPGGRRSMLDWRTLDTDPATIDWSLT